MKKDLDTITAKAHEMDLKLIQATQDLAYLEEFLTRFPAIKQNIRELEHYYFDTHTWQHDRDILLQEKPDLRLGILSEDGLYNVHAEIYLAIKQILKETALFITE